MVPLAEEIDALGIVIYAVCWHSMKLWHARERDVNIAAPRMLNIGSGGISARCPPPMVMLYS
jgi:hypothetical protein